MGKSVRIAVRGASGSGKTVFWASALMKFQEEILQDNYGTLTPHGKASKDYGDIMACIQKGSWIDLNSHILAAHEYDFIYKDKIQRLKITIDEDCTEPSNPSKKAEKAFDRRIKTADVLFIIIDVSILFDQKSNQKNVYNEFVDRIIALKYTGKLGIVFTKSDLYLKGFDGQDLKEALQKWDLTISNKLTQSFPDYKIFANALNTWIDYDGEYAVKRIPDSNKTDIPNTVLKPFVWGLFTDWYDQFYAKKDCSDNMASPFEAVRTRYKVRKKWKKIIKTTAIAIFGLSVALFLAFYIYPMIQKWSGDSNFAQQNYTKAIAHYSAYLKRHPQDSNIQKNIADAYFTTGQYKEAIDAYKLLDRLDVSSIEKRGNAYFVVHDWDNAIKDYTAVLQEHIEEKEAVHILAKRGDAYLEKNDSRHAIADYTEFLQSQPNDPAVLEKLGNAYFLQDDFSEALDAYRKAGRSLDDMLIKLMNQGQANILAEEYRRAKEAFTEALNLDNSTKGGIIAIGDGYFENKRYRAAIETYTAVLDNQNDPAALVKRAKSYAAIADYDAVITDTKELVRTNAEDTDKVEAYKLLGKAYTEKQEYRDAWISYTNAAALYPADADIIKSRGDVYRLTKDYNAAIQDYSEAITLSAPIVPAEYYQMRGDMYYIQKNYEKAQDDYSAVINNNMYETSDVVTAYLSKIKCFINLGDYDGAIIDGNKVINLRPAAPPVEVFMPLGDSYFAKNDYDNAILYYSKAIENNIKNEKIFFNRGKAYYEQRNYQNAINDFSDSIALVSVDPVVFNFRGLAYYFTNDFDKAIADFSRALDMAKNAELLFYRGRSYYAQKDYDRAIADLQEASALDPNDSTISNTLVNAYTNRGDGYFYQNEYTAAISDYETALKYGDFSNKGNMIRAYLERAYRNHEAGNFSAAVSNFEMALNLQGYLSSEDNERLSIAREIWKEFDIQQE